MRKKIKDSVAVKTFLIIFSLLVVCCAIIYGLVLYFLPKTYRVELEKQFQKELEVLIHESETLEDITDELNAFSVRNRVDMAVRGADNELLMVSGDLETIEGKKGAQIGFKFDSDDFANDDEWLDMHIIVVPKDDAEFFFSTTAEFAAVEEVQKILIKLLPLIINAIVIISAIGADVVSRYFSEPLVQISEMSKKMITPDMSWKCEMNRTDEIGTLAKNLTDMSEQLHKNLAALKSTNEKLEEEMDKERKLERQKRDFFNTVSHELKTPITIIKGELQGMIYNVGDYQDHPQYLRHVLKTTNQMEYLVREILSMSKMEAEGFELNKENVHISNIVKKIIREMRGIAEDQDKKLIYDIQANVHYSGDYQLLKKAFTNIIGNAIFHSPAKAEIVVQLHDHQLLVTNKKAHIEQEDLEQLFTPFYRVDQSHNSNTGGSGLGLYIVKTIFDRHGITYGIDNVEDGVQFTVNL